MDKIDPANPASANIYQVVSNLGVFDFNCRTTPCCSVPISGEADEVAENTSFEIHGLAEAPKTRLPSAREQALIREVIDRNRCGTKKSRHTRSVHR